MQTRQIPKNPFKGKLCKCERCNKKFRDAYPDEITIGEDKVELEFIPLCPNCYKKALKKERKKQFMTGCINEGLLSLQEVLDYQNKKLCQMNLDNLVRDRKNGDLPKVDNKDTMEKVQKQLNGE